MRRAVDCSLLRMGLSVPVRAAQVMNGDGGDGGVGGIGNVAVRCRRARTARLMVGGWERERDVVCGDGGGAGWACAALLCAALLSVWCEWLVGPGT